MQKLMDTVAPTPADTAAAGSRVSDFGVRARRAAEYIVVPLFALLVSGLLFSCFLLAVGKSPVDFYELVWRGGFGTAFSLQNTLQRAAPLILTALAMAIPARIGLIMIGGEGALVLSGFSAAAVALPLIGRVPAFVLLPVMAIAAITVGAMWVGLAGYLRHRRGVNETISSLLLTYIAIAIMNFFVEGVLRDPGSANKPSTFPIGDANMIGTIPGTDVHWGLAAGVLLSVALYVLMARTTFGFAARITGGNPRAALAQGLPVGKLIVACSMIAGGCAGVAGFFEVAAIHGRANASLAAGLRLHRHPGGVPRATQPAGDHTGRHHVRRHRRVRWPDPAAHGLPDATVLVLQGFIFVILLMSETLYGRFKFFSGERSTDRA
jgi:simple sugar transport system permease protein